MLVYQRLYQCISKEPPATAGEVPAHVRGTSLESLRTMDCPKRHDAAGDFDEVPFRHDVHQLCAPRCFLQLWMG